MTKTRLLLEADFYLDIFGHADAHDLPQRPFVACDAYYSLVDAHLPVLVGVRAVPARGAAGAYVQSAGGKRDRALDFHSGHFGNLHDLLADLLEVLRGLANQLDPRFSHENFTLKFSDIASQGDADQFTNMPFRSS